MSEQSLHSIEHSQPDLEPNRKTNGPTQQPDGTTDIPNMP